MELFIPHLSDFKQRFPNDDSFQAKHLIFKWKEGLFWKKIFYQHINNSENQDQFFQTTEQALNINDIFRYSILDQIDNLTPDGEFEFLLEYPDVSNTKFNHWSQTSNPLKYKEKVLGYKNISVSWDVCWWAGLALSNSWTENGNYCFIDGSIGRTDWWFSIATKSNVWGTTFPGPEKRVQYVNLWVKATPQEIVLIPPNMFSRIKVQQNGMMRAWRACIYLPFLILIYE